MRVAKSLVAGVLLAVASFMPLRKGFIAFHEWQIGKPVVFTISDDVNAAVTALVIGVLGFIQVMRRLKRKESEA